MNVAPVAQHCDLSDYDTPGDYPLLALATNRKTQSQYDIVVLMDPVRALPNGEQFAYLRRHVYKLKQRRTLILAYPRDEPATSHAYKGRRVRACSMVPLDCAVWITSDPTAQAINGYQRRTAAPTGRLVLAAINHAKRGKVYQGRRDHALWLR